MEPINEFEKYDKLLFPIVITNEKFLVVYKNVAARAAFNSFRIGSSIKKYSGVRASENFIVQKNIFGKDYFISSDNVTIDSVKYTVFYMIESYFESRTKYDEILFNYSYDILNEIEMYCKNAQIDAEFERSMRKFSIINKNAAALRRNQSAFLRFLKLYDFKANTVSACNLYNLLADIKKRLCFYGLNFEFDVPRALCVTANLQDLALIFLNIISFAMLFGGTETIDLSVSETSNQVLIRFAFCDKKGIIAAYNASVATNDKTTDMVVFAPLLSALILTREYKNEMFIECKDEICEVGLILDQNFSMPNPQFTSNSVDLLSFLSPMITEIFR